jgi:hypothetical protein
MGYPTGFIAQVAAVALACHAMRGTQRLARTALFAGLATGFAIWSHPMFGVVALLALITPSVYRVRELRRWWLPLAAGGLVGISPWLLFMADHGWPKPALATVRTTYSERLENFVTELLPRAFGLRAPDGSWLSPTGLAVVVAAIPVWWCRCSARGCRHCRSHWPDCSRSPSLPCSVSWDSSPMRGTRCRSSRSC